MRRLVPVLIVLPVLIVAAVVAAGCGSEDLPSVSVADAAQATRDADTARMTMRVEMEGMGLPRPMTLTAKGVTSTTAPRMDLTYDLASYLEAAGVAGEEADLRVLLDGRWAYADPPEIEGFRMPEGATWAALDLKAAAEGAGIDPAGLSEIFRLTPEQQLAALEAAGNMKTVGEEEVDGVRTTHLRGTITLRDFAATLPPERRARFDKALRQLAELSGEDPQDLDQPTPTELWVDEDAHIRRMTSTSAVPAQDGVPAGALGITVEFSDFGTPLEIERPAEDDVFDATRTLLRAIRAPSTGRSSARAASP